MELPNEILVERAARTRWCEAVNFARMRRKAIAKAGANVERDMIALDLADRPLSTDQLKELASYFARNGYTMLGSAAVRSVIIRQRRNA